MRCGNAHKSQTTGSRTCCGLRNRRPGHCGKECAAAMNRAKRIRTLKRRCPNKLALKDVQAAEASRQPAGRSGSWPHLAAGLRLPVSAAQSSSEGSPRRRAGTRLLLGAAAAAAAATAAASRPQCWRLRRPARRQRSPRPRPAMKSALMPVSFATQKSRKATLQSPARQGGFDASKSSSCAAGGLKQTRRI